MFKLQTCINRSQRSRVPFTVSLNLSASLALFASVFSDHCLSESERFYAGIDIVQIGIVAGLTMLCGWMQFIDLQTNLRFPTGGVTVLVIQLSYSIRSRKANYAKVTTLKTYKKLNYSHDAKS